MNKPMFDFQFGDDKQGHLNVMKFLIFNLRKKRTDVPTDTFTIYREFYLSSYYELDLNIVLNFYQHDLRRFLEWWLLKTKFQEAVFFYFYYGAPFSIQVDPQFSLGQKSIRNPMENTKIASCISLSTHFIFWSTVIRILFRFLQILKYQILDTVDIKHFFSIHQ